MLHSVATPRRPPWLLPWAGCLHTLGQLSLAFVNLLPLGVRASPSLFYLRGATLPYLLSTSPASPRYAEVRRLHGYPSQDPSDTRLPPRPGILQYTPRDTSTSIQCCEVSPASCMGGWVGYPRWSVILALPPKIILLHCLHHAQQSFFSEAAILGVAET